MLNSVKSLFLSQTSKDSSVLFSGTIISTILNIFLVILLTKNLSVEEYGLYVTALIFIQLCTDVSDLGINSAILNFLPSSFGAERKKIVKSTFLLKIIIGIIVALLVFFMASPIALNIFKAPGILPLIRFSSIGIFLLMLIFWGQNIFLGEKEFLRVSIANTAINILRTSVVVVLVFIGRKSLVSLFLASQVVLIGVVIYILKNIDLSTFKEKVVKLDYQKIIRFGLPIGGGFALAAIYTKLDQIMILNISGAREAGIYGLALKLTTFFIFAGSSFSSAFIPRFSSISGQEFRQYFNKTVSMSMMIAFVPILSMPLSSILIPLIFPKYVDSITAFQILALGTAMFILTSPFTSAIIYRYKKPHFSFLLGISSLILIYILLNQLIPLYGALGAAWAVNITYLFQMTSSLLFYLSLSKEQ